MMGTRGISEAVEKGLGAYGTASTLRQRSTALEQEAQRREDELLRQGKQDTQRSELHDMQMQQMTQQLQTLQSKNFENDMKIGTDSLYKNMERYLNSGEGEGAANTNRDPSWLVKAFNANDLIKDQFFGDVASVEHVSNRPEHEKFLQSGMKTTGLSEEELLSSGNYVIIRSVVDGKPKSIGMEMDKLLRLVNYNEYVDKKQWVKDKEKLKSIGTGKLGIAKRMTELRTIIDSPSTPSNQLKEATEEYNALDKQITSTAELKSAEAKSAARDVVTKFDYKSGAESGWDYTEDEMVRAKELSESLEVKLSSEEKKNISGLVTAISSMDKVMTEMAKMSPDDFGLTMQNMSNEINKYIPDVTNASDEDLAKASQSTVFQTVLGAAVVDYIKAISGAAVTNEERALLTKIMSGKALSTYESRESALNAFREVLDAKLKTSSEQFIDKDPYSIIKANQIAKQFATKPVETQQAPSEVNDAVNNAFKHFGVE